MVYRGHFFDVSFPAGGLRKGLRFLLGNWAHVYLGILGNASMLLEKNKDTPPMQGLYTHRGSHFSFFTNKAAGQGKPVEISTYS